jgi:hypothetical protein
MLKHTKRINVDIPSAPTFLMELFMELFTLSWVIERWNFRPCLSYLACETVVCLSHLIKLQCKTFTRVQSKAWVR